MGRIILLRHGQTYSNINGVLDTRPPGAELTDEGREQARAVGEEFAAQQVGIPQWLSSMAIRTQQTSEIAARAFEARRGLEPYSIPVQVTPGLYEVYAGEYEMTHEMDKISEYHVCLLRWLEGDRHARTPGGETYLDVLERFQPIMEQAAEYEGTTIVTSHGAVSRLVATHACGVDPEQAFQLYLANCRYIQLNPQGREFGQWKVESWGDHDIEDLRTFPTES